jgi:hypothetical protein
MYHYSRQIRTSQQHAKPEAEPDPAKDALPRLAATESKPPATTVRSVPWWAVRTSPESAPAPRRTLDLSAGYLRETGVTIVKARVEPTPSGVMIENARGAMVGDHNRQLNDFSYDVSDLEVSVDRLLEGSRAQRQALEAVLADPDSRAANYAFRQRLGRDLPVIEKGARFVDEPPSGGTTAGAQVSPLGGVTIRRSHDVVVGDRNVQHNAFRMRVQRPSVSLAAMLRDRPNLVRAMARALGEPRDAAAQKMFRDQLTAAFRAPGRRTGFLADHVHGTARSIVVDGRGVMLGRHNTRVDRVTAKIGKVKLVKTQDRWTRLMPGPDQPGPDQPSAPAQTHRVLFTRDASTSIRRASSERETPADPRKTHLERGTPAHSHKAPFESDTPTNLPRTPFERAVLAAASEGDVPADDGRAGHGADAPADVVVRDARESESVADLWSLGW